MAVLTAECILGYNKEDSVMSKSEYTANQQLAPFSKVDNRTWKQKMQFAGHVQKGKDKFWRVKQCQPATK